MIISFEGVLLAIFEQVGIIQAFEGKTFLSVGTVAAGKEMFIFEIRNCFD